MNDFNRHFKKGFKSCLRVSSIRLVYQILFYLCIIPAIFFIKKNSDSGMSDLNWFIVIAYFTAYINLILLRALEHVINRLFYLEYELSDKGIITRQEPPNDTNDGNN